MKKLVLGTATIVLLLAISLLAFAAPANLPVPEAAKAESAAIDPAGNVVHPQLPENRLEKVVLIRYKEGCAKDKPCNNDGVCDPDERGWCGDCKTTSDEPLPGTSCYTFLQGSKPRWQWQEGYYYNDKGLGNSSATAATAWNDATPATIFGAGQPGDFPWGTYDLKNTVTYGDYPDPDVIGVTAIWFQGKTIYEYDIMFDINYFPGSVDLDSVVLHEFGHAAGLGDLYGSECADEVMYGYYTGPKTGLGEGDLAGVQALYGA